MKKILGLTGAVLIFGAAGSSDLNTMPFVQIFMQVLVASILLAGSYLLSDRG